MKRNRGSAAGFTLIELIVVISIIGILASMTYAAVVGARRHAEKTQCLNTISQLENAILTYFTEYRRLPIRNVGGIESASNPILSDETLMDVLMAADNERGKGGLTPRGKSFFQGQRARPDGQGSYRNGVKSNSSGGGELFDPWGNHYRIVFDLDNDDRVPAPAWDIESRLNGTLIIWSGGRDGSDSEADDNLTSW